MIDVQRHITPMLWYQQGADAAVERYLRVFGRGRILHTQHWGEGCPMPAGTLLSITVELMDQTFIAFNGGPHQPFNDAASLFVACDTQAEVDRLWEGLTADGGKPIQCGWLQDPWGLRWQIIPRDYLRMASDADGARAGRVVAAMMEMVKLDIVALKRAYDGG